MLVRYLIVFALLWASCQNPTPSTEKELTASGRSNPTAAPATTNFTVQLATTTLGTFEQTTQARGTLRASQSVDLYPPASGQLLYWQGSTGDKVTKGSLLAQLDTAEVNLQIQRANLAVQEAIYNKNDYLALQGGTFGVDSSVNVATFDNILVQSGLLNAQQQLREAKFARAQRQFFAPFDGVLIDVQVTAGVMVNSNTKLGTLINPASLEVEFLLLERDALQAKIGQSVRIRPLAQADKSYSGKITKIEPQVNEQGLVRVYASLPSAVKQRLFIGLNVEVELPRQLPNQLIVPKSAMVLRSGRQVVFTYNAEEQRAKWNYVTIGQDNGTQVTITEGLQGGDKVIVSGNLNLDHDAEVVVE